MTGGPMVVRAEDEAEPLLALFEGRDFSFGRRFLERPAQ